MTSCMDHWTGREIWEGLLCPTAEVAGIGEPGLYLLAGVTGVIVLLFLTEDLAMPVAWSALLGGTWFSTIPGPIPQWSVVLVTLVATGALYLAIKRLP